MPVSPAPFESPRDSSLAGQLSRSSLGDILGHLHRARASGVLVLEEVRAPRAGVTHAIHMLDGRPSAVASDGPRLGELLSEQGELGAGQLAEAVRRKRAGDQRLVGELLCDLGASVHTVAETLARQTRSRLEPLYALGDARVRFHTALFEDVAPPAWVRAARSMRALGPSDFLHGRARAKPRDASLEDARREAFRMLGVEAPADRADLRAAFKRRVVELHPDRATGDEDRARRTHMLARVTAAYQRVAV